MELFWSMELSGLRPSSHACNSLLSCLIRSDRLDLALGVFESMKAFKLTSGHSCSLILKSVATSKGGNAALTLFWELENQSYVKKSFDVIVYNTMISVCGKMNDWVQMDRIWTLMKEKGHVGTSVTFSILVCTFVRCGQYELAIDAYNEMLHFGIRPDNDVMQSIINACRNESKWDLGLNVFHKMLEMGQQPNLITMNALIYSLGKAGKVKAAFMVYNHMKSLGHLPDTFTWNALLCALYKADQYASALLLFHAISRDPSCELNINLYTTALLCCRKLSLWNKAVQLLWKMEESELSVTTASYNLVIATCEAARKPKIALQVYRRIVHRRCVPDTFTFLSLIRCCIWGSLWNEVEEILDQLPPNVSLYNAAIHGMCLQGEIISAKRLYMKMREVGLAPDGKTRALMLQYLQKDSRRPMSSKNL